MNRGLYVPILVAVIVGGTVPPCPAQEPQPEKASPKSETIQRPSAVSPVQTTGKTPAFSFIGSKGGKVQVIDHRKDQMESVEPSTRNINVMTPAGLAREAEARAAREAAQRAAEEARAAAEAKAAEAAQSEEKKPEESKELTPEEGLKLIREKNWITYGADDKNYPKLVFDPFGKEWLPTAEAIKRLQNPPQPGPPTVPAPAIRPHSP